MILHICNLTFLIGDPKRKIQWAKKLEWLDITIRIVWLVHSYDVNATMQWQRKSKMGLRLKRGIKFHVPLEDSPLYVSVTVGLRSMIIGLFPIVLMCLRYGSRPLCTIWIGTWYTSYYVCSVEKFELKDSSSRLASPYGSFTWKHTNTR